MNIEVSYLHSEDIATIAVINQEADIGMGTPYAHIQQGQPLRIFYQLSQLRFFPVVNKNYYQSWQDLNGATIYSSSPGSGTEAVLNLMAQKQLIHYGQMNYLPGSGVRTRAMLEDEILASIVDAEYHDLILKKYDHKLKFLPIPEFRASDETLYAHQNFIRNRPEALLILLEELISVWKLVNQDASNIIKLQKQYQLLPEQSKNKTETIRAYFQQMVDSNSLPNDGGGATAAEADLEFYQSAGTMNKLHTPAKIENFWELELLELALNI